MTYTRRSRTFTTAAGVAQPVVNARQQHLSLDRSYIHSHPPSPCQVSVSLVILAFSTMNFFSLYFSLSSNASM